MAITLPELLVPDAAAWRDWLAGHHTDAAGVRLVLHKKGGEATGLNRAAALEEALCFGWIDGQLSGRDAGSYLLRFTPRRAGSAWSAVNVGIVGAMIEQGRMAPAGLAEVEAARADGRWEGAYSGQAAARPPAELTAALQGNRAAGAAYERLNATNRYAMYYRIHTLKRQESKTRKVAEFIAMLERGQAPFAQPGFAEAPKRTNARR